MNWESNAKQKKIINKIQLKAFMKVCDSDGLRLPWKLSSVKMRNFLFFRIVVKVPVNDHIMKNVCSRMLL